MMKLIALPNFIGTLALLFLNQLLSATEHFINQEGPGLEISSRLLYNNEKISDYTLIIYNENQTSDTLKITAEKSILLKLSYGHYYSLRYLKHGFRERIVIVDTRLNGICRPNETNFDYEISMIPLYENGNTVSDLPVAIIYYNMSQHKFDYSRNYHRQIRGKEIEEIDIEK